MLREVTEKLDPKRSMKTNARSRKKSAGEKIQFAKRGRLEHDSSQR